MLAWPPRARRNRSAPVGFATARGPPRAKRGAAEARASGAGATVRVGRDIANIAGGHAADEGDAMSRAPTCAPLRLAGWKMTCARLRSPARKELAQPVSSGAMRVHTLSKNFGLTISARSGAGAAEAR